MSKFTYMFLGMAILLLMGQVTPEYLYRDLDMSDYDLFVDSIDARIDECEVLIPSYYYGGHDNVLGISWDLSTEDNAPDDILWENGHWYMLGFGNDSVYEYDRYWNYTGTAHYVGAQDGFMTGFFFDDSLWYVAGNATDCVYVYDTFWVYTGVAYDISNETNVPTDIFKVGAYWYLLSSFPDSVYRYPANWVYGGTAYYVSECGGGNEGMYYDGTNWWLFSCNAFVNKYNGSFVSLRQQYYVGNEDTYPAGLWKVGDYWFMSGTTQDNVHRYYESWFYDISNQIRTPLWNNHPTKSSIGMIGLDTAGTDTLWILTQAGWLVVAHD